MSQKPELIKENWIIPIVVFLAMVGISFLTAGKKIRLGPGVKAPEEPLQTDPTGPQYISHDTYHIKVLADFECTAKIISKTYYDDDWSDICPIDYTLGWGKLSDDNYIKHVTFDQRTRWTYYLSNDPPEDLPLEEIRISHANVHMCPANDEVRKVLLSLPAGSVIHFKGKLVQLHHKETGWLAKSSLTRKDANEGACEIVWVEEIENKS